MSVPTTGPPWVADSCGRTRMDCRQGTSSISNLALWMARSTAGHAASEWRWKWSCRGGRPDLRSVRGTDSNGSDCRAPRSRFACRRRQWRDPRSVGMDDPAEYLAPWMAQDSAGRPAHRPGRGRVMVAAGRAEIRSGGFHRTELASAPPWPRLTFRWLWRWGYAGGVSVHDPAPKGSWEQA